LQTEIHPGEKKCAMIEVSVKKKFRNVHQDFFLNVDFEVKNREFMFLFGESGAGKTTILRMIAGLETPDSGMIRVDSEVWYDSSRKINLTPQKRKTGFVFQDYALFDNMTVRQNIEYAVHGRSGQGKSSHAGLGKDKKEFIASILLATGLEELAFQFPCNLSGGQMQRVAFARAIARRPSVFLLDEPFSSLDLDSRNKMHEELKQNIRDFSLTTILVTHDYSDVFKMADRVILLKKGEIIDTGKPSEIFLAESRENQFVLQAEILEISRNESANIFTLLIGGNVIKISVSESEAKGRSAGETIMVASRTFHPVIVGREKS